MSSPLELALKAARLGMYRRDLLTGESHWDARMREIVGLAPDAPVPGMAWILERTDDANRERLRRWLQTTPGTLTEFTERFPISMPDGSVRHVYSRGQIFPGEDGRPRWLTGFLTDVTEEVVAAERLRSADANLASIFQALDVGVALLGPDGTIAECNAAAERILGSTRDALLGRIAFNRRWRAVRDDGSDFPGDLHPATVTLRTGRPQRDTVMGVERPDGSRVWIAINSQPVFDAAGRVASVVASFADITARREANEKLSRTTERLRLALAASRLGAWWHDLAANRSEWDERTGELFGLAGGAESLAEVFARRVHPEDRETAGRAWERMAEGARQFEFQVRILHRNDAVRHIRSVISVQPGTDGTPAFLAGISEDMTERLAAAETQRRLQNQLVELQRIETVGTLAAGISHDFNNLLTGVLGFTDLALQSLPAEQEEADYLRHARSGALQARELVKRLLVFARRAPANVRRMVALPELVRETVPLVRATLPAPISIRVAVEGEVPAVSGDAAQLHQVLMNLCLNAGQAIGARAGTITLSLRQTTLRLGDVPGCLKGEFVCLTVTDDGCGMDAATLARAFDPFFTTKRVGEGTGLGLAIVQGIALGHGGGVRARSTPDRGSSFEVFLPVPADAAAEGVPPAEAGPATIAGDGRLALVVDDDERVRIFSATVLRRAGFTVELAPDGESALVRFGAAPEAFSVAVVDLAMPGMHGRALATELLRRRPALCVVLISGDHRRYEDHGAGQPPPWVELAKPFTADELLAAIGRHPGVSPRAEPRP